MPYLNIMATHQENSQWLNYLMGKGFILVRCNRETETRTAPLQSTPSLSQLPTSNFISSFVITTRLRNFSKHSNSPYFLVLKLSEYSSSTWKPLWKKCFLFLKLSVKTENISQKPLLHLKHEDSLIKMWWRVYLDCTWKFDSTVDSNVKKIPADITPVYQEKY